LVVLGLVVGTGLVAAGCGSSDDGSTTEPTASASAPAATGATDRDYPAEVRSNFLESCTASENTTESQCRCGLELIEDELTLEEYIAAEQEAVNTGLAPAAFARAAAACV
jgi:hypothetical protein